MEYNLYIAKVSRGNSPIGVYIETDDGTAYNNNLYLNMPPLTNSDDFRSGEITTKAGVGSYIPSTSSTGTGMVSLRNNGDCPILGIWLAQASYKMIIVLTINGWSVIKYTDFIALTAVNSDTATADDYKTNGIKYRISDSAHYESTTPKYSAKVRAENIQKIELSGNVYTNFPVDIVGIVDGSIWDVTGNPNREITINYTNTKEPVITDTEGG